MIRWIKKRSRAELIGESPNDLFWHDPKTGEVWKADSRYAVLSVPFGSLGSTVSILDDLQDCSLTECGEQYQ